MIHGRLSNGRLADITYRPRTFADDVPLDAMPDLMGPMGYDAAARRAVPLPAAQATPEERLAPLGVAPLHAALALRLSATWSSLPAATRDWAQAAIDAAASRAAALLE